VATIKGYFSALFSPGLSRDFKTLQDEYFAELEAERMAAYPASSDALNGLLGSSTITSSNSNGYATSNTASIDFSQYQNQLGQGLQNIYQGFAQQGYAQQQFQSTIDSTTSKVALYKDEPKKPKSNLDWLNSELNRVRIPLCVN
jgi:hypothetical protein